MGVGFSFVEVTKAFVEVTMGSVRRGGKSCGWAGCEQPFACLMARASPLVLGIKRLLAWVTA